MALISLEKSVVQAVSVVIGRSGLSVVMQPWLADMANRAFNNA